MEHVFIYIHNNEINYYRYKCCFSVLLLMSYLYM